MLDLQVSVINREVLTNGLDLLSFMLVTPEFLGEEKKKRYTLFANRLAWNMLSGLNNTWRIQVQLLIAGFAITFLLATVTSRHFIYSYGLGIGYVRQIIIIIYLILLSIYIMVMLIAGFVRTSTAFYLGVAMFVGARILSIAQAYGS